MTVYRGAFRPHFVIMKKWKQRIYLFIYLFILFINLFVCVYCHRYQFWYKFVLSLLALHNNVIFCISLMLQFFQKSVHPVLCALICVDSSSGSRFSGKSDRKEVGMSVTHKLNSHSSSASEIFFATQHYSTNQFSPYFARLAEISFRAQTKKCTKIYIPRLCLVYRKSKPAFLTMMHS